MHGYKIGIGVLGDKCCEHKASDHISRASTFYSNYFGTPNKLDQWLLIGLSLGRAGDRIIQLLNIYCKITAIKIETFINVALKAAR
jgi:hypothetical protein